MDEHLKQLYPSLTDEELAVAAEALIRYAVCAVRIVTSIDSDKRADMIKERSNSSLESTPYEHG